jgi:protein O-mannosyl-transferase
MSASTPLVRLAGTNSLARVLSANWFRCIVLGSISIVIHSPALQGQRIWDDAYLAHDNPFIKSPILIAESFRHYLFLDSLSAHYRPIQNISFILDYFFWNTDEFGFHLTNVLLHAACGIALYFLLQRLFASFLSSGLLRKATGLSASSVSLGAFLVALLWSVHPVHSAAVDYISGRADSLAFMFAAIGWLMFLKAQDVSRAILRFSLYTGAAVCGLLALLSREIGCIWIVLFIAHLVWVERQIVVRARVWAIACCVLLLVAYAGLRQLPGDRVTGPRQAGWTAPVRAVLMVRALGDYARLTIFPANLHMERTIVDPVAWRTNIDWRNRIDTEYLSILGLLLLAVFLYGAIKKGRGQSLRVFGACWFIVAYLPISNLFQLNATVAEHWLYLPLVGFFIFLFGCVIDLPERYRYATTTVTLLAISFLSMRSFVRSGDWANEETFYQRTLAAGGESSRVSVNLAQVYARRGDYSAAEKILRGVLQTTPGYPTARINLGHVLLHEGKAAEAEACFRQLFNSDDRLSKDFPRTWIAAVNLAVVRHRAGDDKGAFEILDQARAAHPGIWELIGYESELRRETGGTEEAFTLVKDFARDHWWHYGAAVALGRLYAERDDVSQAEAALAHASLLDVHDAEALHLIAMIKLRQNDLEEAFRTQRRAISRQPDQPSQYILLSNILERMGRDEEARAVLAKVSHLRALAATSSAQSL